MELQDQTLTLNGLDLFMTVPHPDYGYTIHALGDDAEVSDPEAVIASIVSQLQDGDIERVDRHGNRSASIPLILEAPGTTTPGDALARAAAALDGACRFDGWTTMEYTSPLAGAETSVFEVTTATVSAELDDLEEVLDGCRYVTLSIHARPFVRPLEPLTIEAPASIGSTTTPVDDGSSPTNWSALTIAGETPALSLVAGAVRGSHETMDQIALRRTDVVDMSTLEYMRIKGKVALPASNQGSPPSVSIFDNGGTPITAASYQMTSGNVFEIVVHRPEGFVAVDIKASFLSMGWTGPRYLEVDSIEITDAPFGSGAVQSRQVPIFGSQRAEMSLKVLGLDGAGTTPVQLGAQVLVHTASADETSDRAKFLSVREASGATGVADATATSGLYNTLAGDPGAPTAYSFPAADLLPGTYLTVGHVRAGTEGVNTLSFRAKVDSSAGSDVYDPRVGWKSAPVAFADSTNTTPAMDWPILQTDAYGMVPLGLLRLPPADVEDAAAQIVIEMFCETALFPVDLDDIFLCNVDVGQASIVLADEASAVRLDAATVDRPQPSAWVGIADGAMIADPGCWIGENHMAPPGLLQVSTVTPGCGTSRVSARYFPRNHTHVVLPDVS